MEASSCNLVLKLLCRNKTAIENVNYIQRKEHYGVLSNALLKWWKNINFLTMTEKKIRRFPAESQPNGSIFHAVLLQASDMLVLKSCHAESTQN